METCPRKDPSAWPHISRFLHVNPAGEVDYDYRCWLWVRDELDPAELAAAYEEWAGYFEYRLARQAGELAADPSRRYLRETWTDSMAYTSRRLAAWARGEDPGEWIPQYERRPDIFAASRARLGLDDIDPPLAEAG